MHLLYWNEYENKTILNLTTIIHVHVIIILKKIQLLTLYMKYSRILLLILIIVLFSKKKSQNEAGKIVSKF